MGKRRPINTRKSRRRHAEATQRWRHRRARGGALYSFEGDGQLIEMAIRFAALDAKHLGDPVAVQTAVGHLIRRGLEALLREVARAK